MCPSFYGYIDGTEEESAPASVPAPAEAEGLPAPEPTGEDVDMDGGEKEQKAEQTENGNGNAEGVDTSTAAPAAAAPKATDGTGGTDGAEAQKSKRKYLVGEDGVGVWRKDMEVDNFMLDGVCESDRFSCANILEPAWASVPFLNSTCAAFVNNISCEPPC